MNQDGLLGLASDVKHQSSVEAYLSALADAIEAGPSPDQNLDQLMTAARDLDQILVVDRPSSVQYVPDRLKGLRRQDENSWSYVLACVLQLRNRALTDRLRQLSPWPGLPLVFVSYGFGALAHDPIGTGGSVSPDLAEALTRLVSQSGRVYDGDRYLVVLMVDATRVFWVDCGRVGVASNRGPQTLTAP